MAVHPKLFRLGAGLPLLAAGAVVAIRYGVLLLWAPMAFIAREGQPSAWADDPTGVLLMEGGRVLLVAAALVAIVLALEVLIPTRPQGSDDGRLTARVRAAVVAAWSARSRRPARIAVGLVAGAIGLYGAVYMFVMLRLAWGVASAARPGAEAFVLPLAFEFGLSLVLVAAAAVIGLSRPRVDARG